MDIGKDISQKIRTAIKAKLIEIGAYVDDELPDYIMVMVANKKTKDQMADDLNLFLGINTDKFTSWLHGLLSKLQTVGTDKSKTEDSKTSSDVKTEKKTVSPKTKSTKTENETLSTKPKSKEQQSAPCKTMSVSKTNPKVIHVKGVKDPKVIKDVKKTVTDEEYVSKLLDGGEADEFTEELKKEEEITKKPVTKSKGTTKSSTVKNEASRQDGKSLSVTSRLGPVTKTSKVDAAYPKTTKISHGKSAVKASMSSDHSIASPSSKTVPKAAAIPMKRTADAEVGRKVSPPKKKPVSVVGKVVRKYEEEDSDEEYDPYNPAVGTVSSVVKITARKSKLPPSLQPNKSLLIKAVNDAEKSVLQQVLREEKMYSERVSVKDRLHTGVKRIGNTANRPNIIPNFVSRERATVKPIQRKDNLATVQPLTVTLTGKQKEKSNMQLVSKSRRQDMLANMKYTIKNDVEKPKRKQPEVARVPPVMDSRYVKCVKNVDQQKEEHTESDATEEEGNLTEHEEEVEEERVSPVSEDKEEDQEDEEQEENSESVEEVDLENEIEEAAEEERVAEEEDVVEKDMIDEEQTAVEDNSVMTDPEIQQLLVPEDTDLDLEPEKHGQKKEVVKRVIREKKPVPVKVINPKFIVTLDGVDHAKYEGAARKTSLPNYEENMEDQEEEIEEDMEEEEEEEEEKMEVQNEIKTLQRVNIQRNIAKAKQPITYNINPADIQPVSINLQDTDDDEEESTQETPLKIAKMSERCKFWPACVNGNSCQYHHPTTSCKMFPYCKFGEKCLYIHPNCKYDAVCTRKDCPFTHASRRGNLSTIIQKIVPVPVPAATMQPRLPFNQSTSVCRFFPNCTNVSCPFKHPKPCRFGMQCMKKGVCPFSHPALPSQDQMKWTASSQTKPSSHPSAKSSATHISERKFDSPGPTKELPTQVK